MSELLLDSLEIKGYRCFEHLTIEKLGRVNLIVGKNNVGKTALLEALWIYANRGLQSTLYESLRIRDEFPYSNEFNAPVQSYWSIKNLFFNRPNLILNSSDTWFTIGEINSGIELGKGRAIGVTGISPKNPNNGPQLFEEVGKSLIDFEKVFLRTKGLSDENLILFWDDVERKVLDDLVTKHLKIIEERIVDIRFGGLFGNPKRIPLVRLQELSERVPLRSLGEGVLRLLEITLALIKCNNGMVFIDEIESGLHYSVLPDVWKLIFKTAKDLNVQVFATTHSKDCIEAFTQAAIDDEESEGMLIRLERNKEDKIIAKTIEEENLALAIDYGAEVR